MTAQIKFASIGGVSDGTLRDADLLDSFAYTLGRLLERQSRRFPRASFRALIHNARRAAVADREDAGDIVNALHDALGEFAPPYCYFGALEGDGADFGFWVSREAINDAVHEGQIISVADTADIPRDYRGEALHVNDHGNMTLYACGARGKRREIWGIV